MLAAKILASRSFRRRTSMTLTGLGGRSEWRSSWGGVWEGVQSWDVTIGSTCSRAKRGMSS
jgi:hypothetical protein